MDGSVLFGRYGGQARHNSILLFWTNMATLYRPSRIQIALQIIPTPVGSSTSRPSRPPFCTRFRHNCPAAFSTHYLSQKESAFWLPTNSAMADTTQCSEIPWPIRRYDISAHQASSRARDWVNFEVLMLRRSRNR